MIKPTLAIETGIEEEYEQALIRAALDDGWEVKDVFHIPFSDQFVYKHNGVVGNPVEQIVMKSPNVWFHGSISAAKVAQQVTNWRVHAPWNELRCTNYYCKLDGRLLQDEWAQIHIEDVKKSLWESFSHLVEGESLFFRPDGNDKVFTGGCISLSDFDHGYKMMTFYDPPPKTKVIIARPKIIYAEARFLIVNGRLVTGSYYKTGGQSVRLTASDELMDIAEDFLRFCLARGFDPAASWVLDLAKTQDGWSIIEVGASSCCGLYKCDLDLFIKALRKTL